VYATRVGAAYGGTHPAGWLPRFGDLSPWARASGGPYRIQRASFRVDGRRPVTVSRAPFAPFDAVRTHFAPGSTHKLRAKLTLRRRGGGTAELARAFQVCTLPR
jgi:hypothetical protein